VPRPATPPLDLWPLAARIPTRLLPSKVRDGVRLRADFREELDTDWGRVGGAHESVPPADERMLVHAIWGVEFYTPVHAAALVDRLIRLGFDKRRSWAGREKVSDYVRLQRGGIGESWLNLGLVVSPAASGWSMFDAVRIEIPTGVRAGFLQLHTLTSSLTALVAMFVLEDDAAGALERVLRRDDFRASGKIEGRGYTINPPSNVKDAAVKAQRRRTHALVADWIADTLPGAFAANKETTPTAELVTTQSALPLDERSQDLEYLRAAGLANWTPAVWKSSELPNWRLTLQDGDQRLTIARRQHVPSGDDTDERDHDRWSMSQHVNDLVAKDVLVWAAVRLVETAKDRLAHVRDEGRQMAAARRPLKRLRRIAGHYLRDSLEGRTIAAELALYAKSRERFHHNAAEWEGVDNFAGDFLENIRGTLDRLTRDLLATEERVRDGLIIESNMISTIANLRVQRWIVLLTVLTILVGVIAIVVAMRYGG
jgi:hypothetical protein